MMVTNYVHFRTVPLLKQSRLEPISGGGWSNLKKKWSCFIDFLPLGGTTCLIVTMHNYCRFSLIPLSKTTINLPINRKATDDTSI